MGTEKSDGPIISLSAGILSWPLDVHSRNEVSYFFGCEMTKD